MVLDAGVLLLLAAASVLGALAGVIRPLFLAIGTVLGWLAARHLAAPVARVLERALPEGTGRPVAAALLFVAVTSVVVLVGARLRRAPGGGARPSDRALGALLGGAAAAVALWVGVAVADAAAPVLGHTVQAQLAGSDLAALVREHDVLAAWRKPAEEALRQLLAAARDPGKAPALARDPDLRSLVSDERVQLLLEEARAGRRGEPARSPEALRLLSDPEFRERLQRAQERLDRADGR
jgi:uncharacterized membrane protein required for colicin V production